MSKISKIMLAVFAGVIVAMSAKTVAKAEVIYYVDSKGVFVQNTDNPWLYQRMPNNSVIPYGAYVTFNLKDYSINSIAKLNTDIQGYNWDAASYRMMSATKVSYDENGALSLGTTTNIPYYGTGDYILNQWQSQKEKELFNWWLRSVKWNDVYNGWGNYAHEASYGVDWNQYFPQVDLNEYFPATGCCYGW